MTLWLVFVGLCTTLYVSGNTTVLTPVSSALQDRTSILSRLSELTAQPLPSAGSKQGGMYGVVSRMLSPRSQVGASSYGLDSPYSRGSYDSPSQPSQYSWQSNLNAAGASGENQPSFHQRNSIDSTAVRQSPLSDGTVPSYTRSTVSPAPLPSDQSFDPSRFSKPVLESYQPQRGMLQYVDSSSRAASEKLPEEIALPPPDAVVSNPAPVQPRRPPPAPLPVTDVLPSEPPSVPVKRSAPSRPAPVGTDAVPSTQPSTLQRGPSVLSKLTSQLDALRVRAQEEVSQHRLLSSFVFIDFVTTLGCLCRRVPSLMQH